MFSFYLSKWAAQELGTQGRKPAHSRKPSLFLLQIIRQRGRIQAGQLVERRGVSDRRKPVRLMDPDRQNVGDRRKKDRRPVEARPLEARPELQERRAEVLSTEVHLTVVHSAEESREPWTGRRSEDRISYRSQPEVPQH
jgi:hypothetical protein